MIDKTACFTGHRPAKLPWGANERAPECRAFQSRLLREITALVDYGYEHFITGMAQGVDTYAAEILIKLRKLCPQITIEAAPPPPAPNKRALGRKRISAATARFYGKRTRKPYFPTVIFPGVCSAVTSIWLTAPP